MHGIVMVWMDVWHRGGMNGCMGVQDGIDGWMDDGVAVV
jgi:hypothetical protein